MVNLKINPPITFIKSGEEFTVDVYVEEVENLAAYQVGVCWNPNVLECIQKTKTYFFPSDVGQPLGEPDNVNGRLVAVAIYPRGVSGSGPLFTIRFRAKNMGESPINICKVDLFEIVLLDVDGNPIPYTLENGYVYSDISILNGKVSTDATPLEEVSITLNGYTTFSDEHGNYSITVPSSTYTLTASKEGYQTYTTQVNLYPPDAYTLNVTLARPPPKFLLTVTSTPIEGVPLQINGMQAATPCTVELEQGTYTITISPEVTVNTKVYRFKQWSDGETSPTRTIYLTSDLTLEAIYEEAPPPPPPPPPPTYTLTITVNNPEWGTTDSNYPPGSYQFPEGATVTVTAIPYEGYRFVNWNLNGETRTENPITITIDRDYTLNANFEQVPPPPPPPPPPELATLTGKVTGIFGLPVSNAKLTLNTNTTLTSKDGTYTFKDIQPGEYLLTVEHWLYQTKTIVVTLQPGTQTLNIGLTLKPEYPASIVGVIGAILTTIIMRMKE
ncbi:MAG: carboxypeptidase regulatory-like domain-containing protein [Candidatus Bathyarchaeia archaeon]